MHTGRRRVRADRAVGVQRPTPRRDGRIAPTVDGTPFARDLRARDDGRVGATHVCIDLRPIEHAVLLVLQEVVPPLERRPPELGGRAGELRAVVPRTDHGAHRTARALERAQGGVAVRVVPRADHHRRHFARTRILVAAQAASPELPVPLLADLGEAPRLLVEALPQQRLVEGIAAGRRRHQHDVGRHDVVVHVEDAAREARILVVEVVGADVHHDRAQRRWTARRDHHGVEAAP